MLAAEDLSPALTAGDALLQDHTLNADILDELLEATGTTDHEEVMNSVEDDLDELKRVYRPSCIGLSPLGKPTLTQLLSRQKLSVSSVVGISLDLRKNNNNTMLFFCM